MADSGHYTVRFVGNTTMDGHTVYIIKVIGPEGDTWNIQKRYKEIRDLNDTLRAHFGDGVMPAIPGKKFFGNQDPAFIASRQDGLQKYFEEVLQLDGGNAARHPAVMKFLGTPPQTEPGHRSKEYQAIRDRLENRLLNLASPPGPLDEAEIQQRRKKYGTAMKLYVFCMPLDPIHLRAPWANSDPVQLCQRNGERFEQLKVAPSPTFGDAPAVNDLANKLAKILRPEKPLADPGRLLVPFLR
jgi:hypothetical protein